MIAVLLLSVFAAAPTAPTPNKKPTLAVMDLSVGGGADPTMVGPLSEAIAGEVSSRGYFEVVSSRDMQTLLGRERQRQLVGCTGDTSCITELAGALGTRFVLSGSLAKLGTTYQLTLQTLDTQKAIPLGRATRLAKDLETLRAELPWAVSEATGIPPPPPPSHVLPYSLMLGGAAAVVGGAALGLSANSEAATVSSELAQSDANASYRLIRSASDYQSTVSRLRLETLGAIGLLVVGAAGIGLGLFLNPSDSGGGRVALVPAGPSAIAVAGVW